MKTCEKQAMGVVWYLGSKVHLLSAIVFFILSSLWIIKSTGIYNKAWSFTPGVFVCSIRDSFWVAYSSHQSMFSKVTFFRFAHGDLNSLIVLDSLAKRLTFINSFAYEAQETDAQSSSQCVKNGKACGFPGFVLKCCWHWIVLLSATHYHIIV